MFLKLWHVVWLQLISWIWVRSNGHLGQVWQCYDQTIVYYHTERLIYKVLYSIVKHCIKSFSILWGAKNQNSELNYRHGMSWKFSKLWFFSFETLCQTKYHQVCLCFVLAVFMAFYLLIICSNISEAVSVRSASTSSQWSSFLSSLISRSSSKVR